MLVTDTDISTSKNFSELQAKPHPGKTNRKLAQIKVLQGQLPKYYADQLQINKYSSTYSVFEHYTHNKKRWRLQCK